ncbi:MAG TPA: thioester reductase domain-containing protein [Vicinamibacterales bacterium]|nr:thioester reductase domain-containing protein [Vicinamibacterales bacterium]
MTVTPSAVASIAARCLRTPGSVDPDTPLALLGLDSLSTIEMAVEIEEAFGCALPADVLSECADARSLASLISSLQASKPLNDRDETFDAMLADAVLPPDVRPLGRTSSSTDLRTARTILLTGATGFLGGALLDELLQDSKADIVCLVRNPDTWRGTRRANSDRVRTISGDLSHPRLGLGEQRFNELAQTVDAVVHCAAAVNWVYSYSGLRLANVIGTLELLRLACRRSIPFHFISSLSVCYPADGPATADESFDALPHLRGVHLGYAQSKVIAEALVREAERRGLPVRIYRPALISGHSDTGAFNDSDLITALVRGCVQMGTAPDLDWKLDCQPVNVVARSILELSGADGHTFHLGHPRPRGWRECVLWMRMYGYRVRLISYHAWLRQLDVETSPDAPGSTAHPLRPLRTFFLNRHADAHGLTLPELYEETRRTAASSTRTLAIAGAAGVIVPPLDAGLLETYFRRFRTDGVLPDPVSDQPLIGPSAPADAPASMLAALLGTSVDEVRILDSGSEHSIVSELTAWRSRRPTGLYRAEVALADGSKRKLRLKVKAEDADVIAVGEALAALVDPVVGRAYRRWNGRIGFTTSHVREIEIYRQRDPRFLRHTPVLVGSMSDPGSATWMMAVEELEGAALLNTADRPDAWRSPDVDAAVDGLSSLHAIWYGRERELGEQPWIGYVQSTSGMCEMTDLWTALADHAAPAFSSWADPDIASLQRRLIGSVSRWWPALENAPRTLIHHDFNPRNVCLRGGVLCAYDWELASIGAPQRDLAEFLCFVLRPDTSAADLLGWIERHRLALERETGRTIAAAGWRRGFSAALYDLLINRLSTYALVHRIRPQSFLPRVLRTWRGLYEHFPLEEHA